MDSLPNESLLQIFQYIPAEVRRTNLRLVCRRWYRVSLDFALTYNEIIIIDRVWSFPIVAPFLINNERTKFQLVFLQQELLTFENSLSFWSSCGEKIASLSFVDCCVSFETLQQIIAFCPHLKRLSLTWVRQHVIDTFLTSYAKNVNEIIAAASVTTFHFRADSFFGESAKRVEFSNLLFMFPNVTDLELVVNAHYAIFEVEQICSSFRMFEALERYLEMIGEKLKSLSIFWCDFYVAMSIRKNISHLFPRLINLEKLTINGLSFTDIQLPKQFNNLLHLHNLTSLYLCLIHDVKCSVKNLLLRLLKNCANLRILKIDGMIESSFDEEVLQKLCGMPLNLLQFHLVEGSHVSHRLRNIKNFPKNTSMEALYLLGSPPSSTLCEIFFKHFLNLHHLSLTSPPDNILQTIFKYQKHLKSLTLDECDRCTDFGFTGINSHSLRRKNSLTYSIQELKELEYFQYRSRSDCYLGPLTFSRLNLPRLRILKIHSTGVIGVWTSQKQLEYFQALIRDLDDSSNLEFLHLNFPVEVPYSVLLASVKRHKKLRYLVVHDTYSECMIDDFKVEELFQACPSLRILGNSVRRVYYYHNPLLNRTEKISNFDHFDLPPLLMEAMMITKWSHSYQPKRLVCFGFSGF